MKSSVRTRSRFTRGVALVALVAPIALAACGDDDSSSETTAPATTAAATTAAPTTAAATTAAPATTAPGAAGFDDAFYMRLLGTSDIPAYVRTAIDRGATPLTAEQEALALSIWKNKGGETGTGGELSVAYADGFGGNTWRQVAWMEFILQALTYPEIGKLTYVSADGDPQKAISQIQSLIAQDVDILDVYADAGATLAPVVQEARDAGVIVTSFISPPGDAGDVYVSYDICKVGTGMAQTTVDALGGEGNVVRLNGIPGSPYGAAWNKCADEVYDANPGIKRLGSADTNWTPEGAFTAASTFLANESDIDAWNYDYAGAAIQIFRAYESAGRSPDFTISTGGDEQGLFCLIDDLKAEHPKLRGFHGVGGPWLSRVALTAAVDKKNGNDPGAKIDVPFEYQEYTGGCNKDLPEDTPLSIVAPASIIQAMVAG